MEDTSVLKTVPSCSSTKGLKVSTIVKGKGDEKRKYVCQDRTFKDEKFDMLDQNRPANKKVIEFKYFKTNCYGGRHF